jgi:hypothetical protein
MGYRGRIILVAKPGRSGRRFLYVNNRLEGCALWTIYADISGLLGQAPSSNRLAYLVRYPCELSPARMGKWNLQTLPA